MNDNNSAINVFDIVLKLVLIKVRKYGDICLLKFIYWYTNSK